MKNGVIMDIRGRKAVVLTPDGEFTTINLKRNHTLTIGSEIKLAPKPINKKKGYFTPSMPTLAGMAAILLLVVIVTGVIPVRQNNAVAAYVSFDINPSIEVGVNSDLEVVKYQAWNSDGEGLNLERDTMNMPLNEFAELLVSRLDQGGYLADGGKMLIVATDVGTKDRYNGIKSDLEEEISGIEQNESLMKKAVAISTILDADFSTRQEAVKNGVSPGKYMTYLAALDRGASITLDEARHLSVKKMDALQSESMTAVETEKAETEVESPKLEDAVVQLNDKSNKEQNHPADKELIIEKSEQKLTKQNQNGNIPEEKTSTKKDLEQGNKKIDSAEQGKTSMNEKKESTSKQNKDKEERNEKDEQEEKKTEDKVKKQKEKEKTIQKAEQKAEKSKAKEEKKKEREDDKKEKQAKSDHSNKDKKDKKDKKEKKDKKDKKEKKHK